MMKKTGGRKSRWTVPLSIGKTYAGQPVLRIRIIVTQMRIRIQDFANSYPGPDPTLLRPKNMWKKNIFLSQKPKNLNVNMKLRQILKDL